MKELGSMVFENCDNLTEITFQGDAPSFKGNALNGITATAYYPVDNATWTESKLQNYGGTITWVPYEGPGAGCDHANTEIRNKVEPLCTKNGYTGDTYCTDCGTCLALGEASKPIGHNYVQEVKEPTCLSYGYTVTTCTNCQSSDTSDYTAKLDHNYVDGLCTLCGTDENHDPTKIYLQGSNMTLGNTLDMNFFLDQWDLDFPFLYTAEVTHYYADGREPKVERLKNLNYLQGMYYFTYSGVKSKEMADTIRVVVYDEYGEQFSNPYYDSVQNYARRMLDKPETTDAQKALYIEMLNYGAAAQEFFGYNLDNLANSVITGEEQKAYGMPDRTYTDLRQMADGYVGTTLSLENQILFNTVFSGSVVPEGGYAVATFVNHYGNSVEEKVTEFGSLGSYKYASFRTMAVADCAVLITITLYDQEGNVILTVTDSVESYVARMTENSPLYQAIMKFSDAAYRYFHP